MGGDITIRHHGRDIAFLTFVRGLPVLNADRVGSGFTPRSPALVHTVSALSGQPRLLIGNLHGEVMVKDSAGTTTQVGRLRGDQWVTGYTHRPQDESYRSENEIGLVWSGTFADLALVERARRKATYLANQPEGRILFPSTPPELGSFAALRAATPLFQPRAD